VTEFFTLPGTAIPFPSQAWNRLARSLLVSTEGPPGGIHNSSCQKHAIIHDDARFAFDQNRYSTSEIAMPFSVHTLYGHIFKIWRRRRFGLFVRLMEPSPSDILLDVGGYPSFWVSHPQPVKRIDSLNLHEVRWNGGATPSHDIRILVGDGCSLPMSDASYDIGFSNSVIEHVGSWERQQQFASEIRRVSKALWVQTPAYECPIEPHYMTPLIHYFPRATQKKLLRWCTLWGLIERPNRDRVNSMVETTRLLRQSEMRELFPDCEIITERMLWIIPKSYIAIRRVS
jgi:hypothetical protein